MKKVQTQLLVSPVTRDRARIMAVIRGELPAEILRACVEAHLPVMLAGEADRADLFAAAARALKMEEGHLAGLMLERGSKLTMADLFGVGGHPHRRFTHVQEAAKRRLAKKD